MFTLGVQNFGLRFGFRAQERSGFRQGSTSIYFQELDFAFEFRRTTFSDQENANVTETCMVL